MSTYYENLRHPKWQKRRLEIMQRDGFRCIKCGADDKTLNVHHSYYIKGRKPWEYEDDALSTLCEPCHETLELAKQELGKALSVVPNGVIGCVAGFAQSLKLMIDSSKGDAKTYLPSVSQKIGAMCALSFGNDRWLAKALDGLSADGDMFSLDDLRAAYSAGAIQALTDSGIEVPKGELQ